MLQEMSPVPLKHREQVSDSSILNLPTQDCSNLGFLPSLLREQLSWFDADFLASSIRSDSLAASELYVSVPLDSWGARFRLSADIFHVLESLGAGLWIDVI
jgi:hypothetical protein